jgi:hypothetical protein
MGRRFPRRRGRGDFVAKQKKPPVLEFFHFQPRAHAGARILGWIAALWIALVLWTHRARHRTPFLDPSYWAAHFPALNHMSAATLGRHAVHLGFLAAFSALAVLIGRALLKRGLKVAGLNVFETLSFSFALGLGAIALWMLMLAACGALAPRMVFVGTAAALLISPALNRDLLSLEKPAEVGALFTSPGCIPLAALTALILSYEGFQCLAPEVSFDALVYHLALPRLYELHGGLLPTPTNLYSGFPMLIEWAYGFMLYFSDEISAKLVHWACGLGLAAAFLGLGLRAKRPLIGWVACVVFFATPITVFNIVKAAVDTGSAYFTVLAVYALSLSLQRRRENSSGDAELLLSAVLCGLAMGIKYTSWTLLPILAAVLVALKEPPARIIRYALVAVAVLSPWVFKNILIARNPVYPFLNGLFAPHSEFLRSAARLRADAWGRDWPALFANGRALFEALLHPWFMTFNGFTEFDNVGPIYLAGLIAFLLYKPAAAEGRVWQWVILGLWLSWWPMSAMPRLFLPGLALLSVVVAVAVDRVKSRWLLYGLIALLTGLSLDALADYAEVTSGTGNADYLVDGLSRTNYLERSRQAYPSSYFKAAEWINENAPANARVLALNGGRGFYLDRPFLASTDLEEDLLTHWLKNSHSADSLLRKFQDAGVTHVLVNLAWLWRRDPDPGVAPAQLRIFDDFFNRYLIRRYSDADMPGRRWVVVYELAPAGDAPPKAANPLLQWYQIGGATGLAAPGHGNIQIAD